MAWKKYATEEERQAANRRSHIKYRETKAAEKKAAKAHLLTPKGGYFRKHASVEEQQAAKAAQLRAGHVREKARRKAANRAAATATAAAARIFVRDVPAILGSRLSTRIFIVLCEYGPCTLRDLWQVASKTTPRARTAALERFEEMGLVVWTRSRPGSQRIYYLNPGHPAKRELLAFGLRLAERWPSPARARRKVEQTGVALPAEVPCHLFKAEQRSRTLMLIAVTGGLTLSQIYGATSIYQSRRNDPSLRQLQELGFVTREAADIAGDRTGRPMKYRLDPESFAYGELKALLFALVATVYQDVAGTAAAVGRRDPEIAAHVLRFEDEMRHLRRW